MTIGSRPDKQAGMAAHLYYDPYFPRMLTHMKELLAENIPIMIRLYPGHYYPMNELELHGKVDREGHVVAIVGYDDEAREVMIADPWDRERWGGVRGGLVRLSYDTLVCAWVNASKSAAIVVQPWEVEVKVPENILRGDMFDIQVSVAYPLAAPLSDSYNHVHALQAKLTLPSGIRLVGDPTVKRVEDSYLKPGETKMATWRVEAEDVLEGDIKVQVRGIVSSSDPYPYEDVIGAVGTARIVCKPAVRA